MHRSRIVQILNGDPAASPLGGAHKLGAPYSSHRAPQRVRLRYFLRLRPCWTNFLSILQGFFGQDSDIREAYRVSAGKNDEIGATG